MPYIVSILCSIIAAISSVVISRKETKTEIEKLVKQHEFEMETEKERHKYEMEKQNLEHKHQLDMLKVEAENKLGSDVINTMMSEMMKLPEIRNQMTQEIRNSNKKK